MPRRFGLNLKQHSQDFQRTKATANRCMAALSLIKVADASRRQGATVEIGRNLGGIYCAGLIHPRLREE